MKCPICGTDECNWIYKSGISREVVGCDLCCMALDEIDAYEEGITDG